MNLYIGKNCNDESVYCASINGMDIYNPYMSECGRFKVEPSYYGLTEIDAKKLVHINLINGFNTGV